MLLGEITRMTDSTRQPWLRPAVLVAVSYLLVGLAFAALANSAPSARVQAAWGPGAFLVALPGSAALGLRRRGPRGSTS